MIEIKHNTWPLPNMKPIESKEFWHWASIWGLPKTNYVQAQKDPVSGGYFKPVVFVLNHSELIGGGLVAKHYYSGPRAGEVEYAEWRECDHTFEHQSGGNCYHIYTCSKCGARYDVDSSD